MASSSLVTRSSMDVLMANLDGLDVLGRTASQVAGQLAVTAEQEAVEREVAAAIATAGASEQAAPAAEQAAPAAEQAAPAAEQAAPAAGAEEEESEQPPGFHYFDTQDVDAAMGNIDEQDLLAHENGKEAAKSDGSGSDSYESDSDEAGPPRLSKMQVIKSIQAAKKAIVSDTADLEIATVRGSGSGSLRRLFPPRIIVLRPHTCLTQESFGKTMTLLKDKLKEASEAGEEADKELFYNMLMSQYNVSQFICDTRTVMGINVRDTMIEMLTLSVPKAKLPVDILKAKAKLKTYKVKLEEAMRQEEERREEAEARAAEEKKRKREEDLVKMLAEVEELDDGKKKTKKKAKRAKSRDL